MTRRQTVLVTGGTGLVGSSIVDALSDASVVSLSRHGAEGWHDRAPIATASVSGLVPGLHQHVVAPTRAGSHATHVIGDVTKAGLGLTDDAYAELAQRVDLVVHSAGVSDFTMPKRRTDDLNVEGTRNVVAFAERAGVPLYHVSTGYVLAEATAMNGRWGAGIYIDSKREAERIVRDSGLPGAVVRPSIVFADSATGWTPSFQGLHRIVAMLLDNKIPLLPFEPETRVDFLPRDVIGGVTAQLVLAGFRGEFWLTAGPSALRFDRMVELLIDYGSSLGLEVHPPRFVDEEMIDRLIRPAGGRGVERRIDLLLALTTHFSSAPELPSDLANLDEIDIEGAFMRGVEHWAHEQGLVERSGVSA